MRVFQVKRPKLWQEVRVHFQWYFFLWQMDFEDYIPPKSYMHMLGNAIRNFCQAVPDVQINVIIT